jgi:hypothetical protein
VKRAACVVIVVAGIFVLGTICFAEDKPKRGGPPRPAEKPPEYGCVLADLNTDPSSVRDGERINFFLLKYRCREKTRPVNIEVYYESLPGNPLELVKVASDVVLEKGEHTLRLAGGGLARGGRYITELKSGPPGGAKAIARRVDEAVCLGWRLEYPEKRLNTGGCEIELHTDPEVFKSEQRISKFILKTNCKQRHANQDIRISWKKPGGTALELVKIATDVNIPAGPNKYELGGGGVGRKGIYILEIGNITGGSPFVTACTAWTLSRK